MAYYELIAERGDRRVLVAYVRPRSMRMAAQAVCRRAQAMRDLACGDWSIRYSGRTERQAITEGELEYIEDLEAETRA